MILDTQTKKAKKGSHDIKNPVEDFITSMYWMTEEPTDYTEQGFTEAINAGARFGFPVTAIKQATISAGYRQGVTKDMASLRGAFFIEGFGIDQLVEVHGSVPHPREDMVRVGMGSADIRYRGQFDEWYCDLNVTYNKNGQYSLEQIISLINLGGFSCGIGEWRPEKDGMYGRFRVVNA